jgi:hypothetical protein
MEKRSRQDSDGIFRSTRRPCSMALGFVQKGNDFVQEGIIDRQLCYPRQLVRSAELALRSRWT